MIIIPNINNENKINNMSLPYISLNKPNLNRSHPIIIFTKPIQDGVLNRSILIKGLTNMIRHGDIENYFCFTELVLNNMVKQIFIFNLILCM
jgi:hypothetical protein